MAHIISFNEAIGPTGATAICILTGGAQKLSVTMNGDEYLEVDSTPPRKLRRAGTRLGMQDQDTRPVLWR